MDSIHNKITGQIPQNIPSRGEDTVEVYRRPARSIPSPQANSSLKNEEILKEINALAAKLERMDDSFSDYVYSDTAFPEYEGDFEEIRNLFQESRQRQLQLQAELSLLNNKMAELEQELSKSSNRLESRLDKSEESNHFSTRKVFALLSFGIILHVISLAMIAFLLFI